MIIIIIIYDSRVRAIVMITREALGSKSYNNDDNTVPITTKQRHAINIMTMISNEE